MGLWANIKKTLGINGKSQVKNTNYMSMLGNGPIGLNTSSVTPEEMITLSDYMSAVDLVASTFAKIEFTYNKIEKTDIGTRYSTRIYDTNIDWLLNRKPNSYQTPTQFKKSIIYNIFLKQRFAAMIHTERNLATELIPLEPSRLTIERDNETGDLIHYYRLDDDERFIIPNNKILVVDWNSLNGFTDVAFENVHQIVLALLKNMDLIDGNVSTNTQAFTGVIKVPEDVTEDQANQIRKRFASMVGNARESGSGVLVLDPKWEYETLKGVDKRDLVVSSEFRKDVLRRISRAMRIPLGKLGYPELMASSYKSVEDLDLEFTKEAVLPYADKFAEALALLFIPKNMNKSFDYSIHKLIKHDVKTLSEVTAKMINNGVATPNEMRARYFNLPALEGGDQLMINSAATPITSLLKFKESQVALTDAQTNNLNNPTETTGKEVQNE